MREKILIVEDEYLTALTIEKYLKEKYEICGVVQSGAEAIQVVSEKHPALIIMDINLSGDVDGIDTAEKIKAIDEDIAIIYLTGHADPHSIERAKITEPFGYIIKPFNLKELESTISISLYKQKIEQRLRNNERELKKHRDNLEILVKDRTIELEKTNEQLKKEIKEKEEKEKELQRKEAHLRLILNSVKEYSIYTIDSSGFINSWNQGAERLLGFKESEIIGKHASIFIDSNKDERNLASILEKASIQGDFQDEGWKCRKDQTCFWADSLYTAIKDMDGNLLGFVDITRDLTQRKMMEDEIRMALEKEKELRELKNRFISMASHEFRTPLAVILSSAQIIKYYRTKMNEEKLESHLDNIFREVHNFTKILDSVLLIGRIDSGKVKFTPANIELKELLNQAVSVFRSTNEKNISISLEYLAEQTVFYLDGSLIQQVIHNLLSNAIKYSRPSGLVSVIVTVDGDILSIAVKDRGIGIPKEELSKIFEPFHRAENVGTIQGTGLGLVIVKNSVDIHLGKIRVESELNQYSNFIVELPINRN
jgi:PAS domain S-box-containing protein